jgi:cephalosporin hydroxylase
MEAILNIYENKCKQISDINEHLPTLKKYAEKCDHITEMGVRGVTSSWAFLAANPNKMVSYDLVKHDNVNVFEREAKASNIDFTFIVANTTKIKIEETDLLFLDTDHTYEQVKAELKLHAPRTRKYVIFHDTVTFGTRGMDRKKGILPAINEWTTEYPEWVLEEHFENNNGLTVYRRKNL